MSIRGGFVCASEIIVFLEKYSRVGVEGGKEGRERAGPLVVPTTSDRGGVWWSRLRL